MTNSLKAAAQTFLNSKLEPMLRWLLLGLWAVYIIFFAQAIPEWWAEVQADACAQLTLIDSQHEVR